MQQKVEKQHLQYFVKVRIYLVHTKAKIKCWIQSWNGRISAGHQSWFHYFPVQFNSFSDFTKAILECGFKSGGRKVYAHMFSLVALDPTIKLP